MMSPCLCAFFNTLRSHRPRPRIVLKIGRPAAFFLLALLLVPPSAAANESYVLQKGETLYRISKKFEVPVDILQAFNGIENPQTLREGTRIQIPARYTVKKGDTLYGISRDYGVELGTLMQLNGITDSTRLRVGSILYIPKTAEVPASHVASPSAAAKQPPSGDDLLWPLPGKRESLNGKITGTVIHGSTGDTVVSISSGRVIWSGPYRGFSRVILIEGETGYTYVYAGNEETLVAVGDKVVPGAEIGRLGKNVHQGIPQLYFFVYRNGKPVDPVLAPRS